MTSYGVIGFGVMGQAIVNGWITKEAVKPSWVMVADPVVDLKKFEDDLGVTSTRDNVECAEHGDVILLAVKPQVVGQMMKDCLTKKNPFKGKLIISIMAGVSIADIIKMNVFTNRIVRVMPCITATVGHSATALCANPNSPTAAEDLATVRTLFEACGKVCVLPLEHHLEAFTGAIGSGPAYVFHFIDALTRAAVEQGLSWAVARQMVVEMIVGSAMMVQETGKHPAELRDMVCSPGGTTAVALAELEGNSFCYAISEAVRASAEKTRELAEEHH